ncbi:MAG: hypothetical protein QM708_07690 [Propioniciclava sp.]|uniref:hypothetical protein n=1 Tax=Propioniciclava sp. TaxID=2038686 RepID=UPI0039E6F6DE
MSAVNARAPHPVWGPDATSTAVLAGAVAIVWVVAKLVSVWGWVIAPGEYGDTFYYFTAAQQAATGGGVAEAMREYPTPAALLLMLPYELGATHHDSYRGAIVWMTSIADAAFALVLGRRLGPVPVLAWVAITSSLGQLALLRFDMLPAAVAGLAVLFAMAGRGGAASALVALGTGLKIWPIVLMPLTLRHGRLARPAVVLAGVGTALVALSIAVGGVGRLLSPLGYQSDRGLQIEAVAATVPMFTWAHDEAYQVWYSTFHAFEVLGPGVELWLRVAQGASWFGLVACLGLLARWWWNGAPASGIGWLAITLVGTFVVTSRALSPQYLLWLAAPAVVVLGYAWNAAWRERDPATPGRAGSADGPGLAAGASDGPGEDAPGLVAALVTVAGVLILCALTTAVYPVYYGGITGRGDTTGHTLLLLALRNVGLLLLVSWSAVCAYFSAPGRTKFRAGSGVR